MKQRKTRVLPYDSTEQNKRELARYMASSMYELELLKAFWEDIIFRYPSRSNRIATETLALVKLAIAEKIGKN